MIVTTLEKKFRPINIMLVEDNFGDVLLLTKAFEAEQLNVELIVADDGDIALQMLRNEGDYADIPRPDLILLDLNLPKSHGREILAIIKKSPSLKTIPVVIVSSSEADHDVKASYEMHANSYLIKPDTLDGFKEMVRKLEQYWCTLAIIADDGSKVRKTTSLKIKWTATSRNVQFNMPCYVSSMKVY